MSGRAPSREPSATADRQASLPRASAIARLAPSFRKGLMVEVDLLADPDLSVGILMSRASLARWPPGTAPGWRAPGEPRRIPAPTAAKAALSDRTRWNRPSAYSASSASTGWPRAFESSAAAMFSSNTAR